MDIRTFFVTQDREKSTDSVQGAAAQESVEGEEFTVSVEQPTTHSVPLSSGRSDSTLSGTFSNDLCPPPTLYSYARLWNQAKCYTSIICVFYALYTILAPGVQLEALKAWGYYAQVSSVRLNLLLSHTQASGDIVCNF